MVARVTDSIAGFIVEGGYYPAALTTEVAKAAARVVQVVAPLAGLVQRSRGGLPAQVVRSHCEIKVDDCHFSSRHGVTGFNLRFQASIVSVGLMHTITKYVYVLCNSSHMVFVSMLQVVAAGLAYTLRETVNSWLQKMHVALILLLTWCVQNFVVG